MGKTAKISMLRKEKGNRDSGTNFQDIFLRLKIGLTLGLSWEKPEQMKSYINCLFSRTWLVGTEHRTRLRDTNWLANIALLAGKFSYRSHFKAMEVPVVSPTSHTTSEGLQPQSTFKLAPLPELTRKGAEEKAAPSEVGPFGSLIGQLPVGVGPGVGPWRHKAAETGPASLLSSSLQNRKPLNTHQQWNPSCAPEQGGHRAHKWGPAPCMCGQGRPKGGTGIEWKGSKKVL